jgi:y4mF family transcriptional regulator
MLWYFPVRDITMRNTPLKPADIGMIVRGARRAAGLRQDELAGAAGVGLRFIVDLEAGKPTAQIGKALQVLAALGCRIDVTPPPSKPKPGYEPGTKPGRPP